MIANNRKNVYILAFSLLVVMLGFGIVIPIMPFYVERLGAGGTELGLLVASYAVMRLITGPFWGSLSDRVGRKPVLMVGIFGYGITMILFGLATQLWMLFLFRILSGILSSATSPTTMAYIGDSTPEKERGQGMGILGAAVGVGTIIGPGLGGLLAGDNLATPFYIAGGMSFVALLLVWLFLPESLPVSARQRTGEKQRLHAWEVWQAASGSIGGLLLMAFLASFGLTAFFGIFGLYALQKFSAGPEAVGGIIMVFGVVTALAQGLLTGPLTKRWGEKIVIQWALAAAAAGFLFISLAGTYFTFIIAMGLFTLSIAILAPAISSLTSTRTALEQGLTMGLSNAAQSLGRIAGPLLAGIAFDIYIEYPNYLGALVMGIGFIMSFFSIKMGIEMIKRHRSVDIGTHKLHMVVSDLPSQLTIVLEAGGGKCSGSYQEIQDQLARQSGIRVISYDRSGFGQSELGPAHFNAVDEMAALKKCLDILSCKDKLILVGLSYGGFLNQVFTALYPELVSGLVLIDPMNVKFADRFGLDNLNAVTPYFNPPLENYQVAGNRMVDSAAESFAAMRGKELPPDLPVFLITAGNPPFADGIWRQCHEEMVEHSAQHQLIVAEGSHHDIVEENPELVLRTIVRLVDQINSGRVATSQ
jgi:DHA1 family multidrug resistance protein-like MFS transporter